MCVPGTMHMPRTPLDTSPQLVWLHEGSIKAHELACFAVGDSALSNCETTTGRSKASYGVDFRARFVSKCKAGFPIPVAGLRRNLVLCYTCTNSGQSFFTLAPFRDKAA